MPIDTAQLAQLLYGDPAPQGEAGTGAPMQNQMAPTAAPDPILAEVGAMANQPAGNFAPRTVEYDAFGNPSAAPPALPPGTSLSMSTSSRGYSPEKMAAIEEGPMGSSKMAKKKMTAEDETRADFADEKAGLQSAYEAEGAAVASLGSAESERIMAEAGHMKQVAGIQQTHADAMKALNVDAALAAQQAKDEYRARLTAIPELNPNALWDEAGASGQFQMATAAVIHNMLGVKGIKTTAMDTINQAIKNKIDAQIYNINNKKEVAAGFKDLYNMTVAESATQMEVQTKLHGYYLKAMETGIKADMGKYDSAVHRAKGQLALTGVRKELAKTMFEVEKQIDSSTDKAYQREIAIRGQNMQASIAAAHDRNAMAIAKLSKKADAVEPGPIIHDLTKSGRGEAKYRINKNVAEDKEFTRNITNKTVSTTQAIEGLDELNQLQKEIGKAAPDMVGRLKGNLQRREQALRNTIVQALVLDQSGKQVTDKEYERIALTVPQSDWFTNGTNRAIVAQLIKSKDKELNNLLRQTTTKIEKGDPAYGTFTHEGDYGEVEAIAADAIVNPPPAPRSEELSKKIQSPDAFKGVDEKTMSPIRQSEHNLFTAKYWADYKKTRNPDAEAKGLPYLPFADYDGRYQEVNKQLKGQVPAAFNDLRELAEDAFMGDQRAIAALRDLAMENTKQQRKGAEAAYIADMASYFVEKLEKAGVVPGTKATTGFGIDEYSDAVNTGNQPASTIRNR